MQRDSEKTTLQMKFFEVMPLSAHDRGGEEPAARRHPVSGSSAARDHERLVEDGPLAADYRPSKRADFLRHGWREPGE
jgi:hypothetical protein